MLEELLATMRGLVRDQELLRLQDASDRRLNQRAELLRRMLGSSDDPRGQERLSLHDLEPLAKEYRQVCTASRRAEAESNFDELRRLETNRHLIRLQMLQLGWKMNDSGDQMVKVGQVEELERITPERRDQNG